MFFVAFFLLKQPIIRFCAPLKYSLYFPLMPGRIQQVERPRIENATHGFTKCDLVMVLKQNNIPKLFSILRHYPW